MRFHRLVGNVASSVPRRSCAARCAVCPRSRATRRKVHIMGGAASVPELETRIAGASEEELMSETAKLSPEAKAKILAALGQPKGETAQGTEMAKLQAHVAELTAQVAGLHARLARHGLRFSVAQYNILAGYLGNNTEPWFMYGVDMPPERRAQVIAKHGERGADGKYVNVGWPNYVRGILSDDEIGKVEAVDKADFSWATRRVRVVEQIRGLDADVRSLVEWDE